MKAKRLLCSAILAASLFATNANAILSFEGGVKSIFNDPLGKIGNAFLGADVGALVGGKTVGFSLLGVEAQCSLPILNFDMLAGICNRFANALDFLGDASLGGKLKLDLGFLGQCSLGVGASGSASCDTSPLKNFCGALKQGSQEIKDAIGKKYDEMTQAEKKRLSEAIQKVNSPVNDMLNKADIYSGIFTQKDGKVNADVCKPLQKKENKNAKGENVSEQLKRMDTLANGVYRNITSPEIARQVSKCLSNMDADLAGSPETLRSYIEACSPSNVELSREKFYGDLEEFAKISTKNIASPVDKAEEKAQQEKEVFDKCSKLTKEDEARNCINEYLAGKSKTQVQEVIEKKEAQRYADATNNTGILTSLAFGNADTIIDRYNAVNPALRGVYLGEYENIMDEKKKDVYIIENLSKLKELKMQLEKQVNKACIDTTATTTPAMMARISEVTEASSKVAREKADEILKSAQATAGGGGSFADALSGAGFSLDKIAEAAKGGFEKLKNMLGEQGLKEIAKLAGEKGPQFVIQGLEKAGVPVNDISRLMNEATKGNNSATNNASNAVSGGAGKGTSISGSTPGRPSTTAPIR